MAHPQDGSRGDEVQEALLNDEDFLKGGVESFCQKLLGEMLDHLQADRDQRTAKRHHCQNNYKPRKIKTRVGTLKFLVPRHRRQVPDKLLPPARKARGHPLPPLCTNVPGGSINQGAGDIIEILCSPSFSKPHISRGVWVRRSLPGEPDLQREEYPYLIVDALYEKIRIQNRVVSQGILIIIGVGEEGYKEKKLPTLKILGGLGKGIP